MGKVDEKWVEEDGNIKWRRSGKMRPASTAAAKVKKMREQLISEAYEEWSVGQLLRVLKPLGATFIIESENREHLPVSPALEAGDVVMYLGWFECIPWEYTSGIESRITGPKWLIGDRVYMFTIEPEDLVPVYCGEEEEKS